MGATSEVSEITHSKHHTNGNPAACSTQHNPQVLQGRLPLEAAHKQKEREKDRSQAHPQNHFLQKNAKNSINQLSKLEAKFSRIQVPHLEINCTLNEC